MMQHLSTAQITRYSFAVSPGEFDDLHRPGPGERCVIRPDQADAEFIVVDGAVPEEGPDVRVVISGPEMGLHTLLRPRRAQLVYDYSDAVADWPKIAEQALLMAREICDAQG